MFCAAGPRGNYKTSRMKPYHPAIFWHPLPGGSHQGFLFQVFVGCFVPLQSAIVVFTLVPMNRVKGISRHL